MPAARSYSREGRTRDRIGAHRQPLDLPRQDAWSENLLEATRRLQEKGVRSVLTDGDEWCGNPEYSNFDLLVSREDWERAVAVLRGRSSAVRRHPLEPDKLLLYFERGPAVHLHRELGWFGVPVVDTQSVLARARSAPWLPAVEVPAPEEALRLLLAHASFQNLSLDLHDLVRVRRLLDHADLGAAEKAARAEGWDRAFRRVLALSSRAIVGLDAGGRCRLPLFLPPLPSLVDGWAHAAVLWERDARRDALHQVWLRPLLVAAKTRHRWAR